jgi:succinate dehydrogenase / fumarate reductase cytochrome b subunit
VNWLSRVLTSSIGQKLIAALSGLGLLGFMLVHAQGNLRIYLPPALDEAGNPIGTRAIDAYAEHLHAQPWLPLAEISLLILFLVHIVTVVRLVLANRAARGATRYAASGNKSGGGAASKASMTMAISGSVTMAFLLVHVITVRATRENLFQSWSSAPHEPIEHVTQALVTHLSNPFMAIFYVVGSLLVSWHLFHGIQSAARSLGVNHNKYSPLIEKAGLAISIVLALAFASIPVAILFGLIK